MPQIYILNLTNINNIKNIYSKFIINITYKFVNNLNNFYL